MYPGDFVWLLVRELGRIEAPHHRGIFWTEEDVLQQ